MKKYGWISVLLLLQSLAYAQGLPKPIGDSPQSIAESPIGYATVQDAFDALAADPSALQSEYEGWTSFNLKVDGKYLIWSFTPQDHPVHPTAVRREIVNKDGEVLISMAVMCHSSRFDCDQLIEQFRQINENLKRKLANDAGS
jgi:hypothetical protein